MTRTLLGVAVVSVVVLALGCGSGEPFQGEIAAIGFETQDLPPGGAGELYNAIIQMTSTGGASMPDRFDLVEGTLPLGVELIRDREDLDFDGLPDEGGAYTGNARILGFPREPGTYQFTIKAVSTGQLAQTSGAALAATVQLTMLVGEGSISIITPTAAEGTADPAVPAFPETIDFVNPENPQAFFSFSFLIAGGSGDNSAAVYMPRELELSSFDEAVVDDTNGIDGTFDIDESVTTGDKMLPDFTDGGMFMLQAGMGKVQIGGFQSPRGPVGFITVHGAPPGVGGLDPDWFQLASVPKNSRRDFADTMGLAAGDTTLGTPMPVLFSDYFDASFEGTHDSFVAPPGSGLVRRKYPFTADQYSNAFFLSFTPGVDLTPLRFRIIAEAIDRRNTASKVDDIVIRKAFLVQVKIPAIRIDTVVLPDGQAGIDYNEVVAASGGVPPLAYDLELVDGDADGEATVGHALTKDLFGIELDPVTAQFNGVPRAASDANGAVDLTVRVYAAVMNPVQGGAGKVPTGTDGEYDGTLIPGGGTGRHKTFSVYFAPPTAPVIANDSIKAGVDGIAYPGDRITAMGGVPLLAPYPVGFPGTYPSSTARRAYEYTASHTKDASYAPPWRPTSEVGQPGDSALPNALQFEGDPSVPTNGDITGIPYDRGFHTVDFVGIDFYIGDGSLPDPQNFRQNFMKTLGLGISPDSAVYLRGVSGANASGLLNGTEQMGQSKMVPLFAAQGFYAVDTGSSPVLNSALPSASDFLPINLANGGSDAHVDKSIPSISGYWPAESNKNDRWEYYYYGNTSPYLGWKHLQQEHTWIQIPDAQQHRVFLWAETKLKKYNGPWGQYGTSYQNNHRYQIVDRASGKRRGVMILNPLTGRYWVPAVLTNSNSAHGAQFGAEDCYATSSYGIVYPSYSNTYGYYWGYVYGGCYNKYYSYMFYGNEDGREARNAGCGSFIETYAQLTQGPSTHGRTGSSVAVSADGLWCATALLGANAPKILLWRTDMQPIPAAILGQGHVTEVDGLDDTGATLQNTACIIDVSQYGSDPRYLLPDSISFARGGLLFLMERRLSYLHAVSLVDGHLSAKNVNDRTALSAAQGVGATTSSTGGITYADNPSNPTYTNSSAVLYTYWSGGQPVPDCDWVLGQKRTVHHSVQFARTGNQPADGELGPSKLAFIAGRLHNVVSPMDAYAVINNQNNAPYYKLSDDAVRKGMSQGLTGPKAVLFLEIPNGQDAVTGTGLDLEAGGVVIKDLSGHENRVCGDFLTPGRLGEELDFVAVSPDGKYVAAVRNCGYSGVPQTSSSSVYSYYYYSYCGTYGCLSTSTTTTTTYYQSSKDILLFSTDNSDLDTASGNQTVLYLGTGRMGSTNESSTIDNIDYVSAESYLNAYGRRICGVLFTPDSRSLIFQYQGHNSYNPNYNGSAYQYTINSGRSTTYDQSVARASILFNFRTSSNGPISFGSSASSFLSNMMQGLSGVGSIGDTSPPFGSAPGGVQQIIATFRSQNGSFLYYVIDGVQGRNHMVGFNITDSTINGHDPFDPFSTHGNTVGFEQFDCNSWNYECRFAAVPGGVVFPGSARDGGGIVFVIGSDSSAGATSATDLEVYAFDSNIGGDLVALTSAITDGSSNAINYLTVSTDGNVLTGQRTKTASDSGDSRSILTGQNDLFAVMNVHAALAGAAPNAFIVSEEASHGASVAFVGEGTVAGPQAIIFSRADKGGTNTWDDRKLFSATLAEGAAPTALDPVQSFYHVLAGKRVVNDDPDTQN